MEAAYEGGHGPEGAECHIWIDGWFARVKCKCHILKPNHAIILCIFVQGILKKITFLLND
jgi:hypothetical protein